MPPNIRSPQTINARLNTCAFGPTPRALIGLVTAPEIPPIRPYSVFTEGCRMPKTIHAGVKSKGPRAAPRERARKTPGPNRAAFAPTSAFVTVNMVVLPFLVQTCCVQQSSFTHILIANDDL